jgi:nitroreductase
MTFLELSKKRYTSRSFLSKHVPNDKLMYLLEAARVAPSMGNTQSTRIIVLETRENVRKLSLYVQTHDAPLVFLICADNDTSYKDPVELTDSGYADATVVATHIILAAADIDLGSVWVMKFNTEKIMSTFNLPNNFKLIHILGAGYPADTSNPNRHGLKRLPLAKIVTILE